MVTLDKELVEQLAFLTVERRNYEKNREGAGVYNWWIHFNDFHWARTQDMMGLTI